MINKHLSNISCFCTDLSKVENYDKAISDETQMWHCHHRNERFYTKDELIELGLYYNCPPCELIFLTPKEHYNEYHKGRELGFKKFSITKKGHSSYNKNKCKLSKYWNFYISVYMKLFEVPYACSEETKKKISIANKGKTHPCSDIAKDKISIAKSKQIVCVELNKTFRNSRTAAEYLGIKSSGASSSIRDCARGVRNTAYSYHWKFT